MEYWIGVLLSLAVAGLAAVVGLDRDRAFYPTALTVIGSYYVLFAVMGASGKTLVMEIIASTVFLVAAMVGFKKNLWIVVAGLVGHGVFDYVHHFFIPDPGVPVWWPGFCMAFDVIFGGALAVWIIKSQRLQPST